MNSKIFYHEFYTDNESSEIVNLPTHLITKMCEKGRFPGALKSCGHWYIPKACFKISLDENRQIKQSLKEIRQKASDGGTVDEFNL